MQLNRREETKGEMRQEEINGRLQDCLVYDSELINQGIQVILCSTDSDVTS